MDKQVGDVNSTAKGSGARYNAGKAPMELIPLTILEPLTDDVTARKVLKAVTEFQFTGNVAFLKLAIHDLQDYIPEGARVFDYGRKKYSEWNWLKGMAWSIPIGCIGRHMYEIIKGNNTDDESGLMHWGHIMCNLIMLITYVDVYPEGNDLPKKPETN